MGVERAGLAFSALGRWEEALSCYELAVHYNETDAWFWHNYGEALLALDDCEKGIEAFERALQIDPEHEASLQKLELARQQCQDEE
jgi:Ca-activated chloride channel family protein